jgi:hypothetical protein
MENATIKNAENPKFVCGADGKWRYHTGKRKDPAFLYSCARCGASFLTVNKGTKTCSQSCASIAADTGKRMRMMDQRGEKNIAWKGGRTVDNFGYVRIIVPGHHSVTKTKPRVLEHRYVMEQKLGRPLLEHETVHHINGIKTDNRPENLELWAVHQPKGQRKHEQKHCPTCTCGRH